MFQEKLISLRSFRLRFRRQLADTHEVYYLKCDNRSIELFCFLMTSSCLWKLIVDGILLEFMFHFAIGVVFRGSLNVACTESHLTT